MKIKQPIIIRNNEKTNLICRFCENKLEFVESIKHNELKQYFDGEKQVETVKCIWTKITLIFKCKKCNTILQFITKDDISKKVVFKN